MPCEENPNLAACKLAVVFKKPSPRRERLFLSNAVGFFDRGATREIRFIPELAAKVCWDCKECFTICPTSYAQAAYQLTEAFTFSRRKISLAG